MDTSIRLGKYLKLWNLTLRESRIAGKGNKFEVIHQFPDDRHQRILGEFLLSDNELVQIGGHNTEDIAAFILEHTRDILTEVSKNSDTENDNWMLMPAGLI